MARSGRFTHSVVLGLAGQAITMAAGLWFSPFLLHRLGPAGYGLWIVGQQLLTYLTLLDVGVIGLLPRETAFAAAGDNATAELSHLVARTLRILFLQMPAVALLAAAIWYCIPEGSTIRTPVAILAVAFPLLFPLRISRALLEGLQDLAYISSTYMSGWAVGLALSIYLVTRGFGLSALAIGWAVNQAVDAALCLHRLRRRFPHIVPRREPLRQPRKTRDQFVGGLWMSVSQIAQVLIYGTDAAIVGRLFGAPAVVPYNCTGKLIAVLANQPQTIMRAAEPGLSEMRVSESRHRLASTTGALTLAMLLASGLVTTLTLAANPGFVRWWVGPQYYSGALLTVLFAASMLLRHLNVSAIYTLFAFKQERYLAGTSLADGVLSTIFSILLAWSFHSPIGVILGSILSTCCVLFLGNARRLARELNVSILEIGKPLVGWFWRMIVVGWGACLLSARIPASGPLSIALLAGMAAAAYLLLMFPVAMRSSLRPYLLPYVDRLRSLPRLPAPALGKH